MAQTTMSYSEILEQVRELDPVEQADLLEELAGLIKQRLTHQTGKHDIRELRGLGKEVWEGIDATEYVARERAAWGE